MLQWERKPGFLGLRLWSSHDAPNLSICREEQEKLNVWVALLNLENMYGSQESLDKVFERALQYNEPLKVFLHLADIYTKSEKFQVGTWTSWLVQLQSEKVISPPPLRTGGTLRK